MTLLATQRRIRSGAYSAAAMALNPFLNRSRIPSLSQNLIQSPNLNPIQSPNRNLIPASLVITAAGPMVCIKPPVLMCLTAACMMLMAVKLSAPTTQGASLVTLPAGAMVKTASRPI